MKKASKTSSLVRKHAGINNCWADELCGRVLELVKELGCRFVISIGGYKKDEAVPVPGLYTTATDEETMQKALTLAQKLWLGMFLVLRVYRLVWRRYGYEGFSLLVDTPGMNPDVNAAKYALTTLGKFLNLQVNLDGIEESGNQINKMLEIFGLMRSITEEKKKEEQQLRWFI